MHDRDGDGDAHRRELDDAFRLFLHTGSGAPPPALATLPAAYADAGANSSLLSNASASGGAQAATHITMAHLRRIATVLNENVPDELLRDMILEANGGIGVARGVDKTQFDGVMREAGVWHGR
jgi:hypothetical protein